jgi:regulatory protein
MAISAGKAFSADDDSNDGEAGGPATITRLRRRGSASTAVIVELDGDRLAVLEDVDVVRLGLAVGLQVDGELRRSIVTAGQQGEARRRAARLLASRPHARRELERKLTRTAGSELATSVVGEFAGMGLVDDPAFAARVVDRQLRRGYGPTKIEFDLRRTGVDRATVALALAAIERERVVEALQVALRGEAGPAARERAFRRGFSRDVIEDALGFADDD